MEEVSSPYNSFHRKRKVSLDGTMLPYAHQVRVFAQSDSFVETRRRRDAGELGASLLSRGKRSTVFYTEDSHRYKTPKEVRDFAAFGMRRVERASLFDSVQVRYTRPSKSAGELLYQELKQRYASVADTFAYGREMFAAHISPVKVWNASIVGAIFFGMFSMTLVYRYLGQQASAESQSFVPTASPVALDKPMVLGESTESAPTPPTPAPAPKIVIPETIDPEIEQKKRFEAEVRAMVKGYPIEAMLPYIFQQDRDVAAFLIGIGKKESNWGKRVPVLDGAECYNYWGYRGIRDKMGSGGHTCFDGREDAVATVGKRIKTLVQEKKLNTPAKMIVWKCGSTCKGHSAESVRKWIADVEMYLPEEK